jgi:hypothetical protein
VVLGEEWYKLLAGLRSARQEAGAGAGEQDGTKEGAGAAKWPNIANVLLLMYYSCGKSRSKRQQLRGGACELGIATERLLI